MLYPDIPRGRYRHYKGRYYQLIDIAMHSENEQPHAVYRCLYDDYSLWLRPWSMFNESLIIDGKSVPRFFYVGAND